MYHTYPSDGKYIIDEARLILCQSNVRTEELQKLYPTAEVNPLGRLDRRHGCGLRRDQPEAGQRHGRFGDGRRPPRKDLSKADVSANIYAWLKAQEMGKPVELCCAIGDDTVDGVPYAEIVETARRYIQSLGGFEKFAEWGMVR